MNSAYETSFWESLRIQRRVIQALILREIITRYGRQNIGFLWLFVEPLMMTGLIVVFWGYIRGHTFSSLNIIAFMVTGYPLMMMWRNASNRAIGAIGANIALLYHRNVRVLDTLFARMFLEIFGATLAQVVLMAFLIFIGLIPMPADIFYMLMAWVLMAWFAVGLGLVVCSIAQKYEIFGKLWGTLSFISMPLSGAFIFAHNLPDTAQKIMLWFPMVHGTEMFRSGYFGGSVVTMENPWYLIVCNLILLLLGLLMVRQFSDGIELR